MFVLPPKLKAPSALCALTTTRPSRIMGNVEGVRTVAKQILIVDNNASFALMLHDSVKRETEHEVSICTNAGEVQESLSAASYDLAIVDMGLEDEDPISLIRAMRASQKSLRVMAIPLMGEDLSDDVAELDIQGVLTKPFFIGDLADTIEAALLAPVAHGMSDAAAGAGDSNVEQLEQSLPAQKATASPSPMTGQANKRITGVVSDLHRELTAEVVILAGPSGILVKSGGIGGLEADEVGRMLARLSQSATESLLLFAGEGGRIVSHEGYCEGLGRRLYWLALNRGWLLACVLNTETPLGMLRYHLRQAATRLTPLVG